MMLFVVLDLGNVKIGAACGIAPTLRTEREEWGTHFVGRVRMTERPGHPPDVDYAQLQKIYGAPSNEETQRYSPAICIGCEMKTVSGDPDPKHVSTSYVERHNLSMRMGMRRFTRLTNAFSKKIQNHAAMVAIYVVHYNFARIHKTLRITPAMACGLSDHVWTLEEIVMMVESYMPALKPRGPYRKRSAV
jgi:hypothetical protein